ncbi:MAG: photosystem I reaction center subunit IV [Alteromonadaceae bacterium]|nr:photosystem I reaction center subunit IV [Alteromonadaceae bacterium]MBH84303.1 photosystem I reaction center subunit IV [Alteromonadaceae bacterium]|tara:strand:+ start:27641 stop:28783 length:1143 start_codon:yes stop_codon:yes gene_type:complete
MATPLTRRTLAVLLGLSLAASSPLALAVSDVLETPARKTALADDNLLTDSAMAGERIVAVGERGHIIYSDDQGNSWKQGSVPVSTTLTGVYFPTAKHGWAVGHGAVILHTSDGGKTWEKQLDGTSAADLVIATLEKQVEKLEQEVADAPDDKKADLEWALDGMGFALEDAQADKEVGPWKPLLDVWFADENTGFAVGAYGFMFRTDDGGKTWVDWSSHVPNPDRFHLNGITRITGGALVAVGEAGTVFLSTDSGDNWEKVESPYTGSFFGVLGTGDVNELIAFGLRGHVFMSTDLGKTWTTVPNDSGNTLNGGAATRDGRITLVGNGGVVLVSGNGGESFRTFFRDDRQGVMSIQPVSDSALVLFGESGVYHSDINGKSQ